MDYKDKWEVLPSGRAFLFIASFVELVENDPEGFEAEEDEEGGGGSEDIHATSAGQADGGSDPEAGSGGKTTDGILVLLENDGACTDETDTGYDLGCNTRHIPAVLRGVHRPVEAIGGHNHKQGRTQCHEEVGAETGFLGTVLTFQTNGTAQQRCHKNTQDKF